MIAVTETAWNYVGAAYGVTFAAIGGYAAWMIVRGRKVGRQLPASERRWMRSTHD